MMSNCKHFCAPVVLRNAKQIYPDIFSDKMVSLMVQCFWQLLHIRATVEPSTACRTSRWNFLFSNGPTCGRYKYTWVFGRAYWQWPSSLIRSYRDNGGMNLRFPVDQATNKADIISVNIQMRQLCCRVPRSKLLWCVSKQ